MKDRMKLSIQILSAVLLLVTVAGLTYAWFMHNAALSTLIPIEKPDTITISNLDGTDMIELDLDYREGQDSRDEDGWIHIYRPICIRSTGIRHQLEIAHTTNLLSLKFELYPVAHDLVEAGQTFAPSIQDTPLRGRLETDENTRIYENPDTEAGQDLVAKAEPLENYNKDKDTVNQYAYPLYWIAEPCSGKNDKSGYRLVDTVPKQEFDVASRKEITFYYTYYYLEISWKETTKETDLFYVLARNVE